MSNKKVIGLIFPNDNESDLGELTLTRSAGSVPFAGRYRLIDFPLSQMAHANVDTVGVFAQHNYRSLVEHIGSGKDWDLSRKNDGVRIFTPYANSGGIFRGTLEAMSNQLYFLESSVADYVFVCDCNILFDIDLNELVDYHEEKGAAMTLVVSKPCGGRVHVDADSEGRVTDITRNIQKKFDFCHSYLINRQLLIDLVREGASHNEYSFVNTILLKKIGDISMYMFPVEGYCRFINSITAYYEASMDLLSQEVRNSVFPKDRPIYTRVRDEVAAKYGLNSLVSNCLVADGCLIEGTVINSICFRGVKIGAGAVVKNCVLMQGTVVEPMVNASYVITDRDVLISEKSELTGSANYPYYVPRDTKI